MPKQLDLFAQPLIEEYLGLTQQKLPRLGRTSHTSWPVCEDHCFQRIILDSTCGGVWHEYLARPAYKNMTKEQLRQAINLGYRIANSEVNLHELNAQSLSWRGKSQKLAQ